LTMANAVSQHWLTALANQGAAMKSIQVVTEIAAPVETVWAALSQVSTYTEWNPFITSFTGELVTGTRVEVRIAPPGARPMTFRPTVTEVTEGRCVEWRGRLLVPGIVDGRHSFRLEALEDGGTRLIQAEEFSGVLVPLMGKMLERTRAGFEAMNDALRVRAEAVATTQAPL
jgi:hypothetical protein